MRHIERHSIPAGIKRGVVMTDDKEVGKLQGCPVSCSTMARCGRRGGVTCWPSRHCLGELFRHIALASTHQIIGKRSQYGNGW